MPDAQTVLKAHNAIVDSLLFLPEDNVKLHQYRVKDGQESEGDVSKA